MDCARANAGIAFGTLPRADFASPSCFSPALISMPLPQDRRSVLGQQFTGKDVGMAANGFSVSCAITSLALNRPSSLAIAREKSLVEVHLLTLL
jgi:hypothetical protein